MEPVAALVALILVTPVLVVTGITIAILSRRSPFIRHPRVGWRGAPLRMLKFRTMWGAGAARKSFRMVEDLAEPAAVVHKSERDPRITSRFAAICRRYSLDEIPQLYHVARGQMSFVGPRPLTRLELESFYGSRSVEILRLKPGMTGLWQILGRSRLTYSRRLKLDVLMVRRASPALYLKILLRTIPRVLSGNDAY